MSANPDFFEVVRISDSAKCENLRGKLACILGKADEGGKIFLSAWIYDLAEVWSVDTPDLEFLGYKDELAAADYGRHGSIRVGPKGTIVE